MPRDWIPMRLDLIEDESIAIMTEILKLDEYAVIGRLFRIWAWASKNLDNGITSKDIGKDWIDRKVSTPGFAAAMISSGWLRVRSGGLEFPNFDRWMSQAVIARTMKSAARRGQRSEATLRRRDGDIGATLERHDEKPLEIKAISSNSPEQPVAKEEGGKGGDVSSSEKSNPPKSEENQKPNPPKVPPCDGGDSVAVDKPRRRRRKKAEESKPRERNPLFDAIAEVCGVDPALQGSQIGLACSKLKEASPPYTPDEVRSFAGRFHEFCSWAAKDGRTRPTPNELSKWIGGIRTSPKPPSGLFDGIHEKPTNVDHLV